MHYRLLKSLAPFLALVGLALTSPLHADTPATNPTTSPIRHRFVCVDNGGQLAKLIHVDETRPETNWVVPMPDESPRDLQWIGHGRVLVSLSQGYGEYDLKTGKELKKVSGFKNIQTARRLENGHTLLAQGDGNHILVHEVDAEGRPCAEPRRIPGKGSALRQMRVLPNGNLLLHVAEDTVIEVDPAGQPVWSLKLPSDIKGSKGTLAERLWDGSTLASLGNGVRVACFDAQGRELRFWGERRKGDHPAWKLDYTSGFDYLPNGHVVMTNWQGHLPNPVGPHLLEFDEANRLVWQWGDARQARQITNVLVLDRYSPPLDADQERAYAESLKRLRSNAQLEPVSHTIRPFSVVEGLAIQDRLTPDLAKIWGPVSGYKLAYVSKASQVANGIDEAVYGPLFRSQSVPDGGKIELKDFHQLFIEAEVVFTIGQRISGPVASVEELRQHVRSVSLGLEVPDGGRLKTLPGHKNTVADVLASVCAARRYVLGAPVNAASADLSNLMLRMSHNGKQVYEGNTQAIMGDPWHALLWAVERLTRDGKALEPGQVVFSGAVAAVYTVAGDGAAGTYTADGGALGTVSVEVVATSPQTLTPAKTVDAGQAPSALTTIGTMIAQSFNNRIPARPLIHPTEHGRRLPGAVISWSPP